MIPSTFAHPMIKDLLYIVFATIYDGCLQEVSPTRSAVKVKLMWIASSASLYISWAPMALRVSDTFWTSPSLDHQNIKGIIYIKFTKWYDAKHSQIWRNFQIVFV